MKTEEELAKENDMTVEEYRHVQKIIGWLGEMFNKVGIKKHKK